MATLILKPTENCNSNCAYCDVVYKKHTNIKMSPSLLELVFERINEYLSIKKEERMTIIWHGGEPLLLGPEYFEAALEFQEKHCGTVKSRIEHSIQSNLTLFSEKFVDVFRRMGISSIGTSFEPIRNIRGMGKNFDSEMYNKLFMDGIEQLEKFGFGYGIIYVVTKRSLERPLDIFYYLTNLFRSGGINFNPVLIYDKERKHLAVTSEEFVDFLGAIFPVWWKHRDRYPQIEPFRSLVDNIQNGAHSFGCADSGNCAYHHVNIAPDGETSQCGRSADWGILSYGNIENKSLLEIFMDDKRHEFVKRNEVLMNGECKGCRFWTLCHGGCPLDAYSKHNSFMHKSEWCEAKKGFIEKYFEKITGLHYKSNE